MGEWTIVIQGHGIHDNGRPDDADVLCQRFVDDLAAKGQLIQSADFTVGGRRALGIPVNLTSGPFGADTFPAADGTEEPGGEAGQMP